MSKKFRKYYIGKLASSFELTNIYIFLNDGSKRLKCRVYNSDVMSLKMFDQFDKKKLRYDWYLTVENYITEFWSYTLMGNTKFTMYMVVKCRKYRPLDSKLLTFVSWLPPKTK